MSHHEHENEEICCPKFDPTPWQDKEFEWTGKKFIKDKVKSFFYMPLNFGKVMSRINEKVSAVNAETPEWLCLSDHTSMWNIDIYCEVTKLVPGAENVELSGNFYSKVYDGPFKNTDMWMKDFKSDAKARGIEIGKYFMWYTTCPKCAKKYGHNYVVVIGQKK
ncbi:MAG: hypothetical protein A2X64_05695 [Ignavibacteria bacterium GWF2_33_9]|nr:MAG: hypothetical protein A2X64_05695 [Ignavibacteria bacterium GWF2_33_9]